MINIATQLSNIARLNIDGNVLSSNSVTVDIISAPTITKSADKDVVLVNDTLTFTILINNTNDVDLKNVIFSDILPTGTEYIVNSFTVDGTHKTPLFNIITRELSFTIKKIPANTQVEIKFSVLVTG